MKVNYSFFNLLGWVLFGTCLIGALISYPYHGDDPKCRGNLLAECKGNSSVCNLFGCNKDCLYSDPVRCENYDTDNPIMSFVFFGLSGLGLILFLISFVDKENRQCYSSCFRKCKKSQSPLLEAEI